jgi:hypothetical protein
MPNVSISVYGTILQSVIEAHLQGLGLVVDCSYHDVERLRKGLIHAKHQLKVKGDSTYANYNILLEYRVQHLQVDGVTQRKESVLISLSLK